MRSARSTVSQLLVLLTFVKICYHSDMIIKKSTQSKQLTPCDHPPGIVLNALIPQLHRATDSMPTKAGAPPNSTKALALRQDSFDGVLSLIAIFRPTGFSSLNSFCLGVALLLSGCLQTGQDVFHPSVYDTDESDQKPTTQAAPPIVNSTLCASGTTAKVLKIIDGDTIDVRLKEGIAERVRYIGIDTPERGDACYQEATDRNAVLVEGDSVRLIKDTSERDIYGRLVRYVCNSRDIFVNAQLISDGVAHAYRYYPDTGFANQFKSLEQEALQAGRGCLHPNPEANSAASDSACCKLCRNGKACGDSCIPWHQTCHLKPGCACQG